MIPRKLPATLLLLLLVVLGGAAALLLTARPPDVAPVARHGTPPAGDAAPRRGTTPPARPRAATEAEPSAPAPAAAVATDPQAVIRTVDLATRAPLGGTRVELAGGPSARTDADGVARLALPSGAPVARVSASGYESRDVALRRSTHEDPQEIGLRPVEAAREVDVLRGRVIDASGRPLPGAEVTASSADGRGGTCTSDADGAFVLPLPSEIARVLLVAEGRGERGARYVTFGAGRDALVPEDVEIRTSAGCAVVVRIDGGTGSHVVVASQVPGAEFASPGGRWTVRDGTEIVVPAGLAAFSLESEDGHAAAPGQVALATAEGLVAATPANTSGGITRRYVESGPPLRELRFRVAAAARVRVVVVDAADGAPIAGVVVDVEDARLADPFEREYVEIPEAQWKPNHPTIRVSVGRRAPPTHTRSGRTGADGAVEFRGWVPEPAVLRVTGGSVVPSHRAVDSFGTGPQVVRAEIGGTVRLLTPPGFPPCVLAEQATATLHRVEAGDPPPTVRAGRYLVRLSPFAGAPAVAPLATDVAVHRGAETTVDLTGAPPWCTDRIVLRVPGADDVLCSVPWTSRPPVRLADGAVALSFFAPRERQRLEFGWQDDAAAHHHEVDYEVTRTRGATQNLDVSYEPAEIELTAGGLAGRGAVLLLASRTPPRAPHARRHLARLRAREGRPDVFSACVPAGEYFVNVADDVTATVAPAVVEAVAGSISRIALTVAEQGVVIRFVAASTRAPVGAGAVSSATLIPSGDAGADRRAVARLDATGLASFLDVADGRYRLEVRAVAPDPDAEGLYPQVVIHEEVVVVAADRRRFDVVLHAR